MRGSRPDGARFQRVANPFGARFITTILLLGCAITSQSFAAPGTPVTALAFSPDGESVVASAHKSIVVRAVKDGKVHRSIGCEFPRVSSLAFDRDGSLLAVAGGTPGERGSMTLLDWKSSKVLARLDGFDDLVTSVAFSPDNARVAVASADHSAKVARLEGRSLKAGFALAGHSGPVLGVAFSTDGTMIVTASADRTVRVWDAREGKLLRTFSHHTATVHAVAFRPRAPSGAAGVAAFCATASDDKTVRVWQPDIGRMVRIIRGHEGPVHSLAWSPDGARLFTAGSDGMVRAFDGGSDQRLQEWRASDDWIYSVAVHAKADTMATGDWSGSVRLWSILEGAAKRVW